MVDTTGVKGAANDRAVARVLEVRAIVPTPPAANPPSAAMPDLARLSGIAAELSVRPPVDADRVQQIKRAIANGTFPILPATVADRLLAVRYEWLREQA